MPPHRPLKPLREHSALTAACVAEKPPRSQDQLRTPASDWEVDQSAQVAAMNTASRCAAKRARTRSCRRPDCHHDALGVDRNILDDEARWD